MSGHSLYLRMRDLAAAQQSFLGAIPGLPWLVVILFSAVLVLGGLTVVKAKSVVSSTKTIMGADKTVNYKLDKQPLTKAEYQAILDWYRRLNPDVVFDTSKDGVLSVKISSPESHADWLYALSLLQAKDDSVVWEISNFCVGRCGGGAAIAEVKGYRQKIINGSA